MQQLRGKVVLVDFWTFDCVNCLNVLPFVKNWHQKYKDQGLVVIGVHAPEFAFEKDVDNVKKAVADLHVTYPVAIDNEYRTWNAYRNRYWPAEYLLDAAGTIRRIHVGEGAYRETEDLIRRLLTDADPDVTLPPRVDVDAA